MGDGSSFQSTELLARRHVDRVRKYQLVGVEGAAVGTVWESTAARCSIGTHPSNDLVVTDPSVSRFHCELTADFRVKIRDLESSNGTFVDAMQVVEAWPRNGSVIRIGRCAFRFELGSETTEQTPTQRDHFGSLVGASPAMRTTFDLLERAASSDVTVLLEGETGTGKEGAAESIHRAGTRRDQPFLVLDCGAIPANLLESELFGHERGAFTGAAAQRIGIFETAEGGTVFLDEIGELPSELQPKLLRVLERREIRRLGANEYQAVDVRIVAATNRDLRQEVNARRFREDLYFRIAVLRIPMPPLRDRPEDFPILVESILSLLASDAEAKARVREPEFLERIARHAWPGNVRELRNFLERCLVLEQTLTPGDRPATEPGADELDVSLSYAEARRRAIEAFERRYLEGLLEAHDGVVAAAARAAGVDRVYLYKLLHRHGLRFGRG